MPSTYYVAWWNLENLFDEENSPRRTEKLQRTIGADLAGWTPARRDRKVSQLASVIAQMNKGAGPDLLGVCEVENRFVLDLLVACGCRKLDFCSEQLKVAQQARTLLSGRNSTRDSRLLSCRPYRGRSASIAFRRFAAQPGFRGRIEFSAPTGAKAAAARVEPRLRQCSRTVRRRA